DIRLAARRLRKGSGFTAIALTVLAFGVAATTTLFSIVKAVLLDPLPYADPDRLYVLNEIEQPSGKSIDVSYPGFLDYQDHATSWQALAAFRFGNYNLTGAGEPAQIRAAHVSEDYFEVFGVDPLSGRTFTDEENSTTPQAVVVLGYELWQRQFGGREVVGQNVDLNRQPHQVVGVMPEGMDFPDYADLWMPLGNLTNSKRNDRFLTVFGRLKDDADVDAARAELKVLAGQQVSAHQEIQREFTTTMTSITETVVGDSRVTLQALLAAVVGALLIACLNIATLQTVRGLERRRDVAVRAALGAGKGRVLRELLVESLLLAFCGGVLGVLASTWALELLVANAPGDIPRLSEATVDWGVLAFAGVLSAVTGIVFGLAPALQTVRFDIFESLQRGSDQVGHGASGLDLRARLVIAQVALTFVLLIGAGLMVKSLHQLWQVDPGFDYEPLLAMGLTLPPDLYPEPHTVTGFYEEATQRITALPQIESAAAINFTPLTFAGTPQKLEIEDGADDGVPVDAVTRVVTPNYFETLGIRLLAGRDFTAEDDLTQPHVAVVNATLAERYWGDRSPVGGRMRVQQRRGEPLELTVIGVVADLKHGGLKEAVQPAYYRPHGQEPWNYMNLVVRVAEGKPELMIPAVQEVVWQLDPERPMFAVGPMSQSWDWQIARPRFSALLSGVFSLFALLLAAIGLYSVLSFSVSHGGL
ncbi:MAG: ABC transporter permease, partial [Acidobacteriota bacterium]